MNAVVNFAFDEHLVRVVDHEGAPWFVGIDVCRALELSKPENALGSLGDDERYTLSEGVIGGVGRAARVIVSEPGVYRLVFRSRKPEAERFKRWLAHDVLPQIRKTGRYETPGVGTTDPLVQCRTPIDSDAPLDARVAAVRVAERLFGRQRARLVWQALGLPEVPAMELPSPRDAEACLAALLNGEIERGVSVADLLAELDHARLLSSGIRLAHGGFWVANAHTAIRRIMAEWPRFWATLAELPGAQSKTMKFGKFCSKATFVSLPDADIAA